MVSMTSAQIQEMIETHTAGIERAYLRFITATELGHARDAKEARELMSKLCYMRCNCQHNLKVAR